MNVTSRQFTVPAALQSAGRATVACLALAVVASAQTPTVHFAAPAAAALFNERPAFMISDDWNADGALDLVVSLRSNEIQDYQSDGSVVMLRGNGSGAFTWSEIAQGIGHRPGPLASADFDADGALDLAWCDTTSCCFYTGQIHVLLGDGAGDFAETSVLASVPALKGLAAGDLDGDGDVDLIVVGDGGALRMVMLRGVGGGSFAGPVEIPGSSALYFKDVAVADLDLDGDLDIVGGHYGGVNVWRNDAGAFTASWSVSAASGLRALDTGDIDADGVVDIALVRWGMSLHVLRGVGDGSFQNFGPYTGSTYANDVIVVDLTGDGADDVIVSNDPDHLAVYLSRGDGTVMPAQIQSCTYQGPSAVCAGDFNGDGLVDVATPLNNLGWSATVKLYFQDFLPPATYGSAKASAIGCVPSVLLTGVPSATSPSAFSIECIQVVSRKSGLLIYGWSASATPFQGGTRLVATPLRRTSLQNSTGNAAPDDCSGAFAFDMNARIQSGVDPDLRPGIAVFAQYWYRDPADPFGTGLSDAASFVIRP